MASKVVTLYSIRNAGHTYIYIVWPEWGGDHVDAICKAIATHAIEEDIPMTIDEAWRYMSDVKEANRERNSEN